MTAETHPSALMTIPVPSGVWQVPGLHAMRRADSLWVAVEEAEPPAGGELVLLVRRGGPHAMPARADVRMIATRSSTHSSICTHRVPQVMVGDTLSRLTANYYAPCKHRVVSPPAGERIGLPFLFRGRSDAVLNTKPTRERCAAAGRTAHLAEMETTTIKELPAFDSAKSILRGWFKSSKKE